MKKIAIALLTVVAITFTNCSSGGKKAEEAAKNAASEALKEAFGGDVFKAVREGDLETLKKAIESGVDVDKTNAYRETLLMVAAKNGELEIAKYLLEKGADKTKENISGHTAYIVVARKNQEELKALLKVED